MKKLQLLSACAFFLGFISTADAAVITFNGYGVNSDNPVTVDGYIFTYIDGNGRAIGTPADLANELGNGSDFITCRDGNDGDCTISMTQSGGGVFSLQSFDGADGLFNIGGRTIEITGTLFGGGTITDTFTTVANTFTPYSLSDGFVDLVSVNFRGFGQGDSMISFDNIEVNPVPIPAAAWLFGSGLLGLIGIARKKAA